MPNRLWSYAVAAASYAALLGLAALVLPNPNDLRLIGTAPHTELVPRAGFHVSLLGAVLVGALMALLLSTIRGWLVARIKKVGFNWPTLAGGVLAVLLVLFVANGLLDPGMFHLRGWLGWLVTPAIVTLGAFAYAHLDQQLVNYAQKASGTIQGHASAIRQSIPTA